VYLCPCVQKDFSHTSVPKFWTHITSMCAICPAHLTLLHLDPFQLWSTKYSLLDLYFACCKVSKFLPNHVLEVGLIHSLTLCQPHVPLIKYPQFLDILNALNVQPHNIILWGGADKSLAWPGKKQATAAKLGIYPTYSPRSSIQFLARCSNFCKPLKRNSEGCPSNQVFVAAMTSASEEKWRPFNCFFSPGNRW